MITESEFLQAIEVVNNYKIQLEELRSKMSKTTTDYGFSDQILTENTKMFDTDLPGRVIYRFGNIPLGDFRKFKRSDIKNWHLLGKKGLAELEHCLLQAGIVLKD